MTSSRRRPWDRYRELIKSYPGQKESAGSVSLAKEDTASAYSTNIQQGVSTKVKNTNTLPAPADRIAAETVAYIDGLPITIRYAREEAPYRPFLWAAEFPNMTFFFESKAKAAAYVAEELQLYAETTGLAIISDPGLRFGMSHTEACDIRDAAAVLPQDEQQVVPGTPAYTVMLAYVGPEEQLSKYSPEMLFLILLDSKPSLSFRTARPSWATHTDSMSLGANGSPVCVHSATVAEGPGWSIQLERLDTLTGNVATEGNMVAVPETSGSLPSVELLAFSAALAATATQLEVLGL